MCLPSPRWQPISLIGNFHIFTSHIYLLLSFVFQRIRYINPIFPSNDFVTITGRQVDFRELMHCITSFRWKNCSYNLDALILRPKPLIWSHREKLLDSWESPWLLGEFKISHMDQIPEIFLTIGKWSCEAPADMLVVLVSRNCPGEKSAPSQGLRHGQHYWSAIISIILFIVILVVVPLFGFEI